MKKKNDANKDNKDKDGKKQNNKQGKETKNDNKDDEVNSSYEGNFIRIEVAPKEQFVLFRNHDVGRRGGIERVAGQKKSGNWENQAWLISKHIAEVKDGKLLPKNSHAEKVLSSLPGVPKQIAPGRFRAFPSKPGKRTTSRKK